MTKTVIEYLSERYGVELTSADAAHAVTTAIAELVPGNPSRYMLTLINLGANAAYIALGTTPSATNCIILAASGGLVSFTAEQDGDLSTRRWWVVGAGATTVYVIETKAV